MFDNIKKFVREEKIIFSIFVFSIFFSFFYIFTNRYDELFVFWKELMDFLYWISLSLIAAIIFYIFQVYIPKNLKSKKIINNFKENYKYFKLDSIQIFLFVLKDFTKKSEDLINVKDFRNYFNDNNWRKLINEIDDNNELFNDLLFQIELLHKKINLLLLSIDLPNDVFDFFHRLDNNLYKLKYIKKENDRYQNEYKLFWITLKEIFSWYSIVTWNSDIDFIEKNLNNI